MSEKTVLEDILAKLQERRVFLLEEYGKVDTRPAKNESDRLANKQLKLLYSGSIKEAKFWHDNIKEVLDGI